ncbi:MerR family transcriptional regulator [Streptomyces sp. 142MFCol3.1]|uniref:MerR family transcriptional regulator n=1 Tax=Streptomyces sp. 142MFCol3.1 TaxID=1172179 RepID=UPI001F2F3913|nr:MerR family transcriptional regulator [Streptomyces sp. 142MFCol3.1]
MSVSIRAAGTAEVDVGQRLRAVDLARTAGISVQQVRNYVELGVLPPTERTESGYRVFTAAHARALGAAREMAAGHGWPTARVIMRAVHDGDLEAALAALDASHARLDRERAELAAAHEALGTVLAGGTITSASARRHLRIGQVARAVGVRPPVLRLWEDRGLLRPDREPATGYRVYSRTEVHAAQVVSLLRRGHYPLATIKAVLDELRSTKNPDRAVGELAGRARDLHRRSLHRLRASAALDDYLGYLGHRD